jgi:acyl carrier protein
MTRSEAQTRIRHALETVAPEVDAASLAEDVALRDQVDLDSMDLLRFVVELHKQLGVTVPEADYSKLSTLGGAIDYVMSRT